MGIHRIPGPCWTFHWASRWEGKQEVKDVATWRRGKRTSLVSKYKMMTAKVPGTVPGAAAEPKMDSRENQVTGSGSHRRLVWEFISLPVLLYCAVSIDVHVFFRKEIFFSHWDWKTGQQSKKHRLLSWDNSSSKFHSFSYKLGDFGQLTSPLSLKLSFLINKQEFLSWGLCFMEETAKELGMIVQCGQ